jgi:ATP-dependent protease Clp ATPase subunit
MKNHITKQQQAVLTLEKQFPRHSQDQFRGICLILLATGTGLLALDTSFIPLLSKTTIIGGMALIGGLYLEATLLHLFMMSAYNHGLSSKTGSGNYTETSVTYDVAKILTANPHDVTKAFLCSTFGEHIYVRAEITKEAVSAWLVSPRHTISIDVLYIGDKNATTLTALIEAILVHDPAFVSFLDSVGVTPNTIRQAAKLVLDYYYEAKRAERWWSRDSLSQRGSLGRTLTLGAWREYVPHTTPVDTDKTNPNETVLHYIHTIEHILQAKRDSNILLVGSDNDASTELLAQLHYRCVAGTALGSINAMSFISIDHDDILHQYHDTISIEAALRTILIEASNAGNMTIVERNILTATARYATHGVLYLHILEEFLTEDRLHVLLSINKSDYAELKRNALTLLKRCHEIVIEKLPIEAWIMNLTPEIFAVEQKSNKIFSFPTLQAIADTTNMYDDGMSGTMCRLLEVVAAQSSDYVISRQYAEDILGKTYNAPIGRPSDQERDVLLSFESMMHQYIVGQERAIAALATGLRRMRSTLTDTSRPFGSFLFLGPSGVGKTETAETLAKLYFSNQDALIRFDMTEFAHNTSIHRLVGSETEKSLFETIRLSHEHGVILLDEFEKAHTLVQSLFLQIFDEGHITTYNGKTISFHPFIIIATSNAGSDLIARTSDKRALTPVLDSDIISHIIAKQLLSAELIGRFDDVILFDILNREDELTIAQHIINDLKQKVAKRGFTLSVATDVPALIVNQHHDERFGARTIRHAIEQTLEDSIARTIIQGNVKLGDTISITARDIKTIH